MPPKGHPIELGVQRCCPGAHDAFRGICLFGGCGWHVPAVFVADRSPRSESCYCSHYRVYTYNIRSQGGFPGGTYYLVDGSSYDIQWRLGLLRGFVGFYAA